MVLTNAERQARFRRRLHERAKTGVTPEMVVKAARIAFEGWVKVNGEAERGLPTWEKFLADARKRGNAGSWQQFVPSDPHDDYAEYGAHAPMMRAVAKVAATVLFPPRA